MTEAFFSSKEKTLDRLLAALLATIVAARNSISPAMQDADDAVILQAFGFSVMNVQAVSVRCKSVSDKLPNFPAKLSKMSTAAAAL
jgi:hypothetical protein